jgi:hypothetical protein
MKGKERDWLTNRYDSRRINNAGYDLLSQTPTVQINNDSHQNSYTNHSIGNKYLSNFSRKEGNHPDNFTIKNRKRKKPKYDMKV